MCNKQNLENQNIDDISAARARENEILFKYNYIFSYFFVLIVCT